MEPQESPQPIQPANAASMLETGSKILASAVVILYACGFLITSIHNFQYGFSEMNPFRPRILTAGAWFFLFLAVPFTFVRRLTHTDVFTSYKTKGLMRILDLSWIYLASCQFFAFVSSYIFSFDDYNTPSYITLGPWKLTLIVVGCLILLVVGVVVISNLTQKWWRIGGSVLTALLLSNVVWQGYNDFVKKNQFHYGATTVWLAATGFFFYVELNKRSWRPLLGDWVTTLVALLGLTAFFSTYYYPHILSSWGGGMSIPVTITFTKDAVKNASQAVPYELLDETDSGLYVLPLNEKTALFVPRSSVGLVQFSTHNSSKQ